MRMRMTPIRGASCSRPLAPNAIPSSSSSSSSSRAGVEGTPPFVEPVLALPASLSRESSPLPSPGPIPSSEAHLARRLYIGVEIPSAMRAAAVPVMGPPECPACSMFLQSLSYMREDHDKIREELDQACISERVSEEHRRQAVVDRRRMEDAINAMRQSYDLLREECHALHLRMDSSHDPSFISGGGFEHSSGLQDNYERHRAKLWNVVLPRPQLEPLSPFIAAGKSLLLLLWLPCSFFLSYSLFVLFFCLSFVIAAGDRLLFSSSFFL